MEVSPTDPVDIGFEEGGRLLGSSGRKTGDVCTRKAVSMLGFVVDAGVAWTGVVTTFGSTGSREYVRSRLVSIAETVGVCTEPRLLGGVAPPSGGPFPPTSRPIRSRSMIVGVACMRKKGVAFVKLVRPKSNEQKCASKVGGYI